MFIKTITTKCKNALKKLAQLGQEFSKSIQKPDFLACAGIMEGNFKTQIELASSTNNEYLNEMYNFA